MKANQQHVFNSIMSRVTYHIIIIHVLTTIHRNVHGLYTRDRSRLDRFGINLKYRSQTIHLQSNFDLLYLCFVLILFAFIVSARFSQNLCLAGNLLCKSIVYGASYGSLYNADDEISKYDRRTIIYITQTSFWTLYYGTYTYRRYVTAIIKRKRHILIILSNKKK